MEVLELIRRMGRYVQDAGSREKALDLARQIKWLHERMGGWDEMLKALDLSSVRISEGTSQHEIAG
jgi:hypothetical protein